MNPTEGLGFDRAIEQLPEAGRCLGRRRRPIQHRQRWLLDDDVAARAHGLGLTRRHDIEEVQPVRSFRLDGLGTHERVLGSDGLEAAGGSDRQLPPFHDRLPRLKHDWLVGPEALGYIRSAGHPSGLELVRVLREALTAQDELLHRLEGSRIRLTLGFEDGPSEDHLGDSAALVGVQGDGRRTGIQDGRGDE